MAFNLIWLWQRHELFQAMMAELERLQLPPPHVGHQFAFADAHAAIECLRSGKSIGKVVLTLPDQTHQDHEK
jgi:alcohol dehydrogenase